MRHCFFLKWGRRRSEGSPAGYNVDVCDYYQYLAGRWRRGEIRWLAVIQPSLGTTRLKNTHKIIFLSSYQKVADL